MSEEISTAPTSESTGTVEEAASKIEALLSGRKRSEKQEAPQAENTATKTSDAVQADDVANEEQSAETASDEDDADDTPPPQTDDEAESDDGENQLFTVKINGKDEQVSLKEALAGYQRQQDYTRAKQAFHEEKNQFAEELKAAKQEREVYAQLLPALMQRMQAGMPAPPDASLIDTDPSAYLRQKEAYERELGDYQAAAAEHQRLQRETQVEQQRKLQSFVEENVAKLPELIPEWKDKQVFDRDRVRVRDYLKGRGFSEDEINQAYDARLVAIAADGMRWRELQKSKPKPTAPRLEKALKPNPAPQPQSRKDRDAQAARNRLRNSGRVEDAAAAIKALL